MKYISLLLFSGLILPFYNASILQKTITRASPKAITPVIEQSHPKKETTYFFIYQELAKILFPELVN